LTAPYGVEFVSPRVSGEAIVRLTPTRNELAETLHVLSVLFLSSVPLAIIGNLLRILMLTFGIMTIGPETAIGRDSLTDPSWFHMLAGYLVFAVALGGMLGIGWLLPALRDNESLLRKRHRPLESAKRSHQRVETTKFENLPSETRPDPY
jgi:exosortase/archaeosortase family protein